MLTTISPRVDADLLRLRTEFATMPGLCLTADQTARLLAVRKPKACALLDTLVVDGLLVRSVSGIYRRARFW
jgi:hypothetical protein